MVIIYRFSSIFVGEICYIPRNAARRIDSVPPNSYKTYGEKRYAEIYSARHYIIVSECSSL